MTHWTDARAHNSDNADGSVPGGVRRLTPLSAELPPLAAFGVRGSPAVLDRSRHRATATPVTTMKRRRTQRVVTSR
jgi:hypothetical protein